jgi:hypothetical protein
LVIAFDHGTTLRVPLDTGRPLEVVEKIHQHHLQEVTE